MKAIKIIILYAFVAAIPFAMSACQTSSDKEPDAITEEQRESYLLGFESGYNAGHEDGMAEAFNIAEINGTFKCTKINGADFTDKHEEAMETIYGSSEIEMLVWYSKITVFNDLGDFDYGNLRKASEKTEYDFEIYLEGDSSKDEEDIITGYVDVYDSNRFEIHYTEKAPESRYGDITSIFERTGY